MILKQSMIYETHYAEKLRNHANYVNIKNKRTFLFNDNNCHNLKNLKCKIFYEVLLKKEISCPLYQKHFNIKYKINQEEWSILHWTETLQNLIINC